MPLWRVSPPPPPFPGRFSYPRLSSRLLASPRSSSSDYCSRFTSFLRFALLFSISLLSSGVSSTPRLPLIFFSNLSFPVSVYQKGYGSLPPWGRSEPLILFFLSQSVFRLRASIIPPDPLSLFLFSSPGTLSSFLVLRPYPLLLPFSPPPYPPAAPLWCYM